MINIVFDIRMKGDAIAEELGMEMSLEKQDEYICHKTNTELGK